jgi:phage terminase large subunit GpA-like protein
VFDSDNCTWAHYVCEECGKELDESDKDWMIARGEWRITNPAVTDIAGFHINELYSTFNTTWLNVARTFLDAKKSTETLKTFINNSLGETFEEDALTISDHLLEQRKEDYEAAPTGCYLLTAGIDVQADRLETSVWGWGADDEQWLIAHEVFYGNPLDKLVWQHADEYLMTPFRHVEGGSLRVRCAFVDSGFSSDEVYAFTAPREARGVFAIKGYDGKRDLIKFTKRNKRTRALLIILGVDEAKMKLYDLLSKQQPGPGYVHLNKYATLPFCQQLTAEKRLRRVDKKGRSVIQWILPGNRQNHALDMAVYAYCAKKFLNPNFKKLAENYQARMKKPTGQTEEQRTDTAAKPVARPVNRIIKKGSYWR